MPKTCIARTQGGSRCKNPPLLGSNYCFIHSQIREKERIRKTEQEEMTHVIALHEASHATVALYEGCFVSEVTVVEQHTKVTFPTSLELETILERFDEEKMLLRIMANPKVNIDKQLRVLLAGWAANSVLLPDSYEFQGCEEDIRKACELLIGPSFDLSEIVAWIFYRLLVLQR